MRIIFIQDLPPLLKLCNSERGYPKLRPFKLYDANNELDTAYLTRNKFMSSVISYIKKNACKIKAGEKGDKMSRGDICGIIDFSNEGRGGNFEILRQMWCSVSALGRAYAYINKSISVCCDRQKGTFCTLPKTNPQKKGENCTLILNNSLPFTDNDLAKDMLMTYLNDGAEIFCERYANEYPEIRTSFALFDESSRFVMLCAATSRFYVTHEEHSDRIFFSTDERSLVALSELGIKLHYPAALILPHGTVLHCDVRSDIPPNITADRSQL